MNSKKLIISGLPMIAVTYGLSRFSFGLMLPYIRESLALSQSVSGLISSLAYLAYCIAIIVSMFLTTKTGPKAMILTAGFASTAGLIIISVSNNGLVLGLGIFILAGLSTGLSSQPVWLIL